MKVLEKRQEEAILDSIIDNEFFKFCKKQASESPGDWEGIIVFTDNSTGSAAMPDTMLWEKFNEDRKRAMQLAKNKMPTEEAIKILTNPENLNFARYATTKKDRQGWEGLQTEGKINPDILAELKIELQKTYWDNRDKSSQKRWYHALTIPAITAGMTVTAMLGLYLFAEYRIERKVEERTYQVERKVDERVKGIEGKIDEKVKSFEEAQKQNSIEAYLPRIRQEVEIVLQDYERRANTPEKIVNGVVGYLKEHPEVLRQLSNDEQFKTEIRGIIFEAMRPK